ncbi:transferase hexapeptide repeat containing protein [Parafrankia sp. EAN1pec]|uniref:acyltransferase n=1 Tax=Parafrankia sp. (strain EAN1pec) TaxID=298653 RepID=UPI00015D9CAA|nr:transferase hexapeptide repeat containing protein [Frankia sp. EAN1pec]
MSSSLPERSLDLWRRARSRAFTRFLAGSFGALGPRTDIEPPFRLYGARWMSIGAGVHVGPGSWFQVIDGDGEPAAPVIRIGAGSSFVGWCTLSAVRGITIGDRAMFARGVYVADHDHAYRAAGVAIRDQGHTGVAPVVIGDGAWLGQNCVVTAGSTIGRGAVVGANSVVKGVVPDFSLAVGAPARVVRSWASHGVPSRP